MLGLAGFAFANSAQVGSISHDELTAAVAAKSVTLLDVNGSASYKAGRIPGAIDYTAQKEHLASLLPADKNALVVAYCGSEKCGAYKAAASAALALGYTNVRHYSPGIAGWKKSGAPLEKS